ncbi:MAG TPA: hypothetical protein PL154_03975, partial [Candidatus Woesebacteria bacterium]|nr:hypothetical protein [Candidatus Woesebacteria bacterium]
RANQGQQQTTPAIPNFSEEIVPLQANAVSEKPTSDQAADDFALKLNQVPSPVDLKQKTINNNPNLVEL